MDKSRIPVLVGCGQVTRHDPDPAAASPPIDLIADAARAAAADTGVGAGILQALDTLVVIRAFADTSWRFACPFGSYANPPKSLAARLGADAARRQVYTWPGGNMPQWCVNRLFEMVTRGEVEAALIAGGEALATQKAAQRAGLQLDWSEDPGGAPEMWGVSKRGWNDVEDRHRMAGAIYAYPLIETAIRGAAGADLVSHQAAMGRLFARFAAVAAGNPLADRRDGYDAATIATPGPGNPYIVAPYTRLMNANAFIDQSAALILTSVAKAEALGIPQDRWVHLHGCADATDSWYLSDRAAFHRSPAMHVTAREALAMAGSEMADMAALDLYSCFPSAVEIACAEMGIAPDDPRGLTVTGGLPYFGGPGNNYVTHSIAEMMNRMRAQPGAKGLVTANGNYITKHSAGIYSTAPADRPFAPKDPALYQAEVDAVTGPPAAAAPQGPATVETYAVVHDRKGPSFAILYARQPDGSRFIANTPDDPALLADIIARDHLGATGRAVLSGDGRCVFTPD
ncbi:MAG: acetyl-CoA acetyltransferase [Sneathiellaceae bacterium]